MKDNEKIDPKEVWEILEQLGLYTHYLASKPIAFWDEYDHSNYKSLQFKAGKIKKFYGIYDTNVKQKDVYIVDSPPNRFYKTKEEATIEMNKLISTGTFSTEQIHILEFYKTVRYQ